MALSYTEAQLEAMLDALHGSENIYIRGTEKFHMIDVADGKMYEVWLDGGVFTKAITGVTV